MGVMDLVSGEIPGGGGRTGNEGVGTGGLDLTESDIFGIVSNDRRRYTLQVLQRSEREMALRELAERVATIENDTSLEQVTTDERRSVETALRQFHLPKMADTGFVRFDQRRKTVELVVPEAVISQYLGPQSGPSVPWGVLLAGAGSIAIAGYLILLFTWLEVDSRLLTVSPLLLAAVAFAIGSLWVTRTSTVSLPLEAN